MSRCILLVTSDTEFGITISFPNVVKLSSHEVESSLTKYCVVEVVSSWDTFIIQFKVEPKV